MRRGTHDRELRRIERQNRWATLWFLVALAVIMACMSGQARSEQCLDDCPPRPDWDVKSLLSKYNCAWVRERRKIYSDEELEAMARQMHLPEVVIAMAKRCPR